MKDRFSMDVDPKTVFMSQKHHAITDFNLAVLKGASKPFLISYMRKTKQDITECNKELGLLPEDGFNLLDMKWKERYE